MFNHSNAYKILSDAISSILREAKMIKEDSKDENIKYRKDLTKVVYDLIVENSKLRKLLNRLNKMIKHL